MGEDLRRLFVINLPLDITEAELRGVFELYGEVVDMHINAEKEHIKERSAFVNFGDPHEAISALMVLNDMYKFRETGPAMTVTVARPREQRDGYGKGHGGDYSSSWGAGGGGASSGKGEGGYGSHKGDGYKGDGNKGDGNKGGGYKGDGQKGDHAPGTKLWIGNLPGDITPEVISKVFSTYGKIEEVSILPVKAKSGQACAFLFYADSKQADACIAAMAQGYEIRPGDGEIKVERPGEGKGKDKGGWGYGKGGGKYDSGKGSYDSGKGGYDSGKGSYGKGGYDNRGYRAY